VGQSRHGHRGGHRAPRRRSARKRIGRRALGLVAVLGLACAVLAAVFYLRGWGRESPAALAAHHASARAWISGLTLSPAVLASATRASPAGRGRTARRGPTDGHGTTVSFIMKQAADVTVCILDSANTVVRQLTAPAGRPAGRVSVAYDGYDAAGKPLLPGRYNVLVVASNTRGSATAEVRLTMSAP
jgi:hypothetical protein